MPEEHPPLGKPFIAQYDGNDPSYPILSVIKDLRAGGYQLPARNSQTGLWADWQVLYPNNKFTGVQNIDEQRVQWIYQILPGPWIPFTRYDLNLGPIQGRRRQVIYTGQSASLTSTTKTTYEARDGSDYVSWEIEEISSDGTGSPGNPPFPILTDDQYDAERGPVQRVSQAVLATGSEVGSMSESGGLVTKISYQAIDQYKLNKIIETWTLPGPEIVGKPVYDIDSGVFVTVTKKIKPIGSITAGIDHQNDTSVTIVTKEAIDAYQGYEVTKVIPMSYHDSSATAKISYEVKPYQFPGWIFVEALDAYGTAIGYRKTYSETVNHIIRTWWVIKDTAPSLVYDEITPGDIVINDVSYKNVLHDETTRIYAGSTITVPETTPSFTDYYGTADVADPFAPGTGSKWVGEEKIIGGSVEVDGADRFRFKITTISVVMQ